MRRVFVVACNEAFIGPRPAIVFGAKLAQLLTEFRSGAVRGAGDAEPVSARERHQYTLIDPISDFHRLAPRAAIVAAGHHPGGINVGMLFIDRINECSQGAVASSHDAAEWIRLQFPGQSCWKIPLGTPRFSKVGGAKHAHVIRLSLATSIGRIVHATDNNQQFLFFREPRGPMAIICIHCRSGRRSPVFAPRPSAIVARPAIDIGWQSRVARRVVTECQQHPVRCDLKLRPKSCVLCNNRGEVRLQRSGLRFR